MNEEIKIVAVVLLTLAFARILDVLIRGAARIVHLTRHLAAQPIVRRLIKEKLREQESWEHSHPVGYLRPQRVHSIETMVRAELTRHGVAPPENLRALIERQVP